MAFDLGRLAISKIIVHEIPQRMISGKGDDIVLSETESPASAEVLNYFRERVVASLAHAAYQVRFDPTSASPVPAITAKLLKTRRTRFVERSVEIAKHLHSCQTGVNPDSLLVVALARVAAKEAVAILKLEKEAGVRVQQSTSDGKKTFSLQHLKDLMLTARTRVFKTGLFVQNGKTHSSIAGRVSDAQRSYTPTTEVAGFFLTDFLGCTLIEASDVSTKRFFEATQAFINDAITSPDEKARYQIALLAEMSSNKRFINPKEFAKQTFPTEKQNEFLTSVQIDGAQFAKDTALVKTHLRRVEMDFVSGIAVLAPPDKFADHIKVVDLEGGDTKVEITDRVVKVKGR